MQQVSTRGTPQAFYIPITIPVVLDGHRPQLGKILIFYQASNCFIKSIEVWDGARSVLIIDGLNLTGDHSSNMDASNNWVIEPAEPIMLGLGIFVNTLFTPGNFFSSSSVLRFTSAGADFLTP